MDWRTLFIFPFCFFLLEKKITFLIERKKRGFAEDEA